MRRGSKPAPAIAIKKRWFDLLEKEGNKDSCSRKNYIRIQIILRASQGFGNKEIAREIGVTYHTVKKWRNRWKSSYTKLEIFEKGPVGKRVANHELIKKMLEVLKDSPRKGAPCQISLSAKQQIVAIACEEPEDYGVIMTGWTLESLAAIAIKKQIVPTISPSYIGRLLKNKQASTK